MGLRVWLTVLAMLCPLAGSAQGMPQRSAGQALYLPVYSHIWHGEADSRGERGKTLMSVLVSIRNTDPNRPIRINAATYFDTGGRRIKEYLAAPHALGPMATFELFVPRSDDRGGSGANFVITWKADTPVSPPVVEALHVNLPAGRSIAFITSARPIAAE